MTHGCVQPLRPAALPDGTDNRLVADELRRRRDDPGNMAGHRRRRQRLRRRPPLLRRGGALRRRPRSPSGRPPGGGEDAGAKAVRLARGRQRPCQPGQAKPGGARGARVRPAALAGQRRRCSRSCRRRPRRCSANTRSHAGVASVSAGPGTSVPARARANAVARPRPLLAPGTIASLPERDRRVDSAMSSPDGRWWRDPPVLAPHRAAPGSRWRAMASTLRLLAAGDDAPSHRAPFRIVDVAWLQVDIVQAHPEDTPQLAQLGDLRRATAALPQVHRLRVDADLERELAVRPAAFLAQRGTRLYRSSRWRTTTRLTPALLQRL